MLQRTFTHDGQAYRIELSTYSYRLYRLEPMTVWEGAIGLAAMGIEPTTYRAIKGDSAVLRAALDTLAADSYRRLRLTHSAAIDRMIERLAGRELPCATLLAAKQKLNLI
jgi:hypothetical protein